MAGRVGGADDDGHQEAGARDAVDLAEEAREAGANRGGGRGGGGGHCESNDATVEPLYCGYLGDLVKCPI